MKRQRGEQDITPATITNSIAKRTTGAISIAAMAPAGGWLPKSVALNSGLIVVNRSIITVCDVFSVCIICLPARKRKFALSPHRQPTTRIVDAFNQLRVGACPRKMQLPAGEEQLTRRSFAPAGRRSVATGEAQRNPWNKTTHVIPPRRGGGTATTREYV